MHRRDALRVLSLAGLGAALGGCASSGVGTVGDPLPGEPVGSTDTAATPPSARTQDALDRWRNRGRVAPGAPSGVIARRSWASYGPNPALADPMRPVNRITVHHDGMNAFTSTRQDDAMARLEQIRRAHVGRGWADIGYHYAIDPAGRVYEGRPLNLQGAHVKDENEGNLGILVMGNFMLQRPAGDALRSLETFLADQMRRYRVSLARVYTHQELRPTACPGESLQREMLALRRRGGPLA